MFRIKWLTNQLPYVVAELSHGNIERFILDTGYLGGDVLLRRSIFDDLCKKGQIERVVEIPVANAAGEGTSRTGVLESFSLGEFVHHDLAVSGGGEISYLTLGFLSRYTVTIDFRNDRLYLKPARRFKARGHYGAAALSGLGFSRIEGVATVEWVDPDGPKRKKTSILLCRRQGRRQRR